ncbi:MAG: ribonuclease E/G [Rhodospirillaceae bacterium]|nr:ribonuclease E/G [Rhodospirillaceae bacterium]
MPLAAPHDSLHSAPIDEDAPSADALAATESEGAPAQSADLTPSPNEFDGNAADAELPATPHGEIVEVAQPPEVIDTVGGEEPAAQEDDEDESDDDDSARRRRQRHLRRYKIQEVIKRRQILLVQVTKEERGNKGAALTTYLSLAGRYCVLMPNTDRGGGISRRITSVADRKRLKSIVDELDPPEGMAVIVRTAGMERQRSEIKRDFEYLLRLWDEIRENTLRSTAPALIYEEASLIKRSIRDLYTRDIGDIVVAGAEAYKSARSFMRMLAPAQAKRVQFYRDPTLPLFQRHQIESQIAAIHHPVVTLRSGGYIVINQTEALVAVDVNSGRSTRERNIEETALRTNLEAAEEVARQLRLRDLAGLIVIDFIDMDEGRNNAAVERRMKDALRNDRARIQIGRISSFGLLEMSRQRLHASLQEASTEVCPHCHGTGRMRSVDSTALHVLRMVEEEITRNPSPGVSVHVPTAVALFILNQKRHALAQLELRRGVRIYLNADDDLTPPDFRLERIKQLTPGEELPPAPLPSVIEVDLDEEEALDELEMDEVDDAEIAADASDESADEDAGGRESGDRGEGRGKRRRRRRSRGGRFQADEFTEQADAGGDAEAAPAAMPEGDADQDDSRNDEETSDATEATGDADGEESRRRRRRGRRGGRRRSRRQQDDLPRVGQDAGVEAGAELPGSGEQPDLPHDAAALPPQWRSEESDGRTAETVAGEDDKSASDKESRPRRARRPRRSRDDEASLSPEAPPAGGEPTAMAAAAAPDVAPQEPVSWTSQPQPAQSPESQSGNTQGATEAGVIVAEENDAKKRGWWRRLIE